MEYEGLKDTIETYIRENGNEEITGEVLQSTLLSMVGSLGSGYQFVGVADTDTEPSALLNDNKIFYLATEVGEYEHFGGIVVNKGELAVLVWDTEWHKLFVSLADYYTKDDVDELLEDKADAEDLDAHVANTSNPHNVTQSQVGLDKVNNTADLDKPISTATQVAISNVQIDLQRESIERKNADAEFAFKTSIIGNDLSVSSPAGVAAGGVASDTAIGGGGGTNDHRQLTNRDAASQHPISAIDGLQSALNGKAPSVHTHDDRYYTTGQVNSLLEDKVDKDGNKVLSTNDFTDADKEKLDDLENYDDTEVRGLISGIEDKIPDAASSSNKLADKAFVNSSIGTATATFRGTSAKNLTEVQFMAWANGLTKDLNDYIYWDTEDSAGNAQFKRYKYNGSQWQYEYTLNNSSFTADEWASIKSGITSGKVTEIGQNTTARHTHSNKNVLDGITAVDDALSTTSTNPVQNKVVKGALDTEVTDRTNADNALAADIATEETNRKNADTALSVDDANIRIDLVRESIERKNADSEFAFKTSIIGEDLSVSSPAGVAAGGVASDSAIGGGGTYDHTQLTNRDAANQHPISAIDGLQGALNGKQGVISDLSDIRSGASAGATAYQKPTSGIPKTDLASAVQTSLGRADSALQSLPSHTHTKSQITDFPASMPASDVHDWAKEPNKPSYTASEVGALPSGTTHLSGDIATSEKGAADGVATLDSNGKLPSTQLPTAVANHITATNNPHGVTKSQVELGNVVNTGDSAIPVSGGTTKFTTGGAYTLKNDLEGAINGEAGVRSAADSALSGRIYTEINDRRIDDANIRIDLTRESIERKNADSEFAFKTSIIGDDLSVSSPAGVAAGGVASDNAIGNGGTNDHRQLTNRDAAEQHPISAITGLASTLDGKQGIISDLDSIRSGASAGATAYQKPTTGIPKSDLASAVQTSLGKADSALQQHQSLDGYVNGITTDSTTSFADNSTIVVGKSGKNILTRTASALFTYIKSKLPSWSTADTKPTYSKSEIGLDQVNNTSDADKPISTATRNALNAKGSLVTQWQSSPDHTHYPSEKLVRDSIDYEASARSSADTTLTNNLNTEVSNRRIDDSNIRIDLTREGNERRNADAELAFKTSIIGNDLSVASPAGVAAGGVTSDVGLRPYKYVTTLDCVGDVRQLVTHNLGSTDVAVTIYKYSNNNYWQVDNDASMVEFVSANEIHFYPFQDGQYKLIIIA